MSNYTRHEWRRGPPALLSLEISVDQISINRSKGWAKSSYVENQRDDKKTADGKAVVCQKTVKGSDIATGVERVRVNLATTARLAPKRVLENSWQHWTKGQWTESGTPWNFGSILQIGGHPIQHMPPKVFAWIVEGLRNRAGLSQTALARKCSITLRTIQRLEAGDPVARSTRRALAAAFREGDAGIFDNPEFIALASRLYRESQNARTAVISRILVDGGSVARSPYPLSATESRLYRTRV